MTATMVINDVQNGIELYFEDKPEQKILNVLKINKWRWHNVKKCWYSKQSEVAFKTAQDITENKIPFTCTSQAQTTKEVVNECGIKIGDIFYTSWGYEQTNVDFYQVIELRGKTTVILREIAGKIVPSEGYSSMAGLIVPQANKFVNKKLITKRVNSGYGNGPIIKFDHSSGHLHSEDDKHYCSWYY